LRTIEVRSVAQHSCGTERKQQINRPIGGGKSPQAHGSYREFIGIMVPNRRQISPNLRLPNLTPVYTALFFFLKVTPGK
jgi:hypothetical protein